MKFALKSAVIWLCWVLAIVTAPWWLAAVGISW